MYDADAGIPTRRRPLLAVAAAALAALSIVTLPMARARAATTLSISTTALPSATVGTVYSQALAASGGTSPYTWKVSAGNLPAGLSLSTDGLITGPPTVRGKATVTVTVTDAASATGSRVFSLPVSS